MTPFLQKKYDAIVIGAGHNGLAAAAYLGRGGLRVLVLERREVIGGCCVTEEIAPGCRASTVFDRGGMLHPRIIRDLDLENYGLRMVQCEPRVQACFADGSVMPWWTGRDRMTAELEKTSPADTTAFLGFEDLLQRLARRLHLFFLEPPPDPYAWGLNRWSELLRVAGYLKGITGADATQLISLIAGSLGDFLDCNFKSERVKSLILAGNLWGVHGGPYQAGQALGYLYRMMSGGEGHYAGLPSHVMGGMGAITTALAAAAKEFGAEIKTSSPVKEILIKENRTQGVALDDGTEIAARAVLSGADPKRTFLGLVPERWLAPEFRDAIGKIKMDGPCAKVNLVLGEEPRVQGMPADSSPARRSIFSLIPSLQSAEHAYQTAKFGGIPDDLAIDCVVASQVDQSLAPPGRHILTCLAQFVPYRLRQGDWDKERESLGDRVVARIAEAAPNVPNSILSRQVLTPLDLERIYGLTEGNMFHGDMNLEQLFVMRPRPGWAHYQTPIEGLYLCGSGAHPGGGVTGAPGHNAAYQALKDLQKGQFWRRE